MTKISKKIAETQPFVEVKKKFSDKVERIVFTNELRGTINLTSDSKSYMVAGTGITIKSGSDALGMGFGENQVIFEASGGAAAGLPGATVNFDPLSVVFAADSAGNISAADYEAGNATIKAFLGGEQINVDNSVGYAAKTFRVIQGSPVSITAGAVTQNDGDSSATVAAPSSMTQDQAEIPYQIIVTDSELNTLTFNVTQQFARARQGNTGTGTPGSDGYFIVLTPQSVSLPTTAAGTVDYTPSGATISAYRGGTQLQAITAGTPTTGQFKLAGITGTGINPDSTPSISGTDLVFSDAADMTGDSAIITYSLNLENIATNTQAIQTLAKTKAGADGSPGDPGDPGVAINVLLDPLAVQLSADSSGTVSDYSPSGATIKVMINGSFVNIDNSDPYGNNTFRVNSATGTNITAGAITQVDGDSSATVADASAISADNATINHSVTVKDPGASETTITVTQQITKSKQGPAGSSGNLVGNTSIATGDGTDSATVPSVDSAVTWDPDGYTATSDPDGLITPEGAAVANHLIEIDKSGLYHVRGFCFKITPQQPPDNSYTWSGRLRLRKSSGGLTTTVFQSSTFSTGASSFMAPSSTSLPEIDAIFTAVKEDYVFVDILVTERNTVPGGTTFTLTSSGSNYGELQFTKSNAI